MAAVRPQGLPPLISLLSVAAGLVVANLYYCQPLLPQIGASFGAGAAASGALVTFSQLGYGLGILILVPLGDRVERARLIALMTAVVALMLFAEALAPTLVWVEIFGFAVGFCTIVPQLLIPYASHAVPEKMRGQAVGTVLSGLLIGILLSRTASGFVGGRYGWRAMFGLAGTAMLALALAFAIGLPKQTPERRVPLGELFRSLWELLRREPLLRRHALIGGLAFGAFSVFWTTLAFFLQSPPWHYGADVAGLYGLVGVAGALAAPVIGRLADLRDPGIVNLLGLTLTVAAFAIYALTGHSLLGLGVGVLLMDLGVQSSHVANQTKVFGLDPALRSRLNTLYMVGYFTGGALGSALGAQAYRLFGWTGACGLGGGLALAGIGVYFGVSPPAPARRSRSDPLRS